MPNFKIIVCLTLAFGIAVSVPQTADAQAGQAVKKALTSKAAIKFYDLMAGYLLGKTLDSIYASATAPDPKQLDSALGTFQKDHPEYTVMLGTLRRAVKTDGTPTTRAEFEMLANDLVFQMDNSLLNQKIKPAPPVQFSPPSASSILAAQGLGLSRIQSPLLKGTALDGTTPLTLRGRLTDPLAIDGTSNLFRHTPLPLLSQIKVDNALAAKIVGAWSFSHMDNKDSSGADVYIFHRDGKITEYKVFGRDEIFTFNGTYTVDGNKLNIRWELPNGLGDVLSASIEEMDMGHLKYTPDKGAFEIEPPKAKTLTRVSDVGMFSVVTLSNPTEFDLNFEIRWATIDGYWTPWEPIRTEPRAMWSIPQRGGFYCQLMFDSSFDEGRQEVVNELPFNVVPAPTDPKLLDVGGYRIHVEGGKIHLTSEKLTLDKPAPGVR